MQQRILVGSLTRPMPQYESAAGEGLSRLDVDLSSARVVMGNSDPRFDDCAWTLASSDGRLVFATHEGSEEDQSEIVCFRHDATSGTLAYLGSQPTGGREACHATLSPDGRYLVVASYNGEALLGLSDQSLSICPISPDAGLGPASDMVRFEGAGPNSDRQQRAHADCVRSRLGTELIYAADLGSDQVRVFHLSPEGRLTPRPDCDDAFAPGDGPRHLVFTADGRRMLTVCELTPKVTCHYLDTATGRATVAGTFNILSLVAKPQPAGIILASDDATLLVSLRVSNEILALCLEADGWLTELAREGRGGRAPRDLALSPDGRRLFVANQDSSAITVFDFDPVAARLGHPRHFPVGTPMTVTLLPMGAPVPQTSKAP